MTLLNHVLTGMPSTKRIAVIENPSFSKIYLAKVADVEVMMCQIMAGSIAHGEVGEGGLGPNYKSWWGV